MSNTHLAPRVIFVFLLAAIAFFLFLGEFFAVSKYSHPVQQEAALRLVKFEDKPTAEWAHDFYLHHFQQINALNGSSIIAIYQWMDAFRQDIIAQKGRPSFRVENEDFDQANFLHSHFMEFPDVCKFAKMFHQFKATYPEKRVPHVLLIEFNENWGAFSETIPNRTTNWVDNLTAYWEDRGCSNQTIMDYLDHPETQAVVTTQFQAIEHPKVISIPLGIKRDQNEFQRILRVLNQKPPSTPTNNTIGNYEDGRPILLLISSAPSENRLRIFDTVIDNFAKHGFELKNQYAFDTSYDVYLEQLRSAKFILSPSGLGLDCYRHWEAILMGTIPVIEHLNRSDGWFRALDGLPVAWIDSYGNLTPEWLEKEYHHIMSQWKSFQYEKLKERYWIDFVQSTLKDSDKNQSQALSMKKTRL
jgi:hypothetical protein